MKSSENFSCCRIDRSIERSPAFTFISRSMRRSSLLLNRPIMSSLRITAAVAAAAVAAAERHAHAQADQYAADEHQDDSFAAVRVSVQAVPQARERAPEAEREAGLPPPRADVRPRDD